VPGAIVIEHADPIYRGLAAMLDVPESALRDRATKESNLYESHGVLPGVDTSVRGLLRSLGTEWGRELVHPDLWLALANQRIDALLAADPGVRIAIPGVRFHNEVESIRSRGGAVAWIHRPGLEPIDEHKSDRVLTAIDCDAVIVNDGTPAELAAEIARFTRS
jgi:hypothetical protein